MEVYIYAADVYCSDCAQEIMDDLDAKGKTPEFIADESSYDSSEYPKGPIGSGESDSPQHCASCHVALENDLTSDGVEYVIDALKEYIDDGKGSADVLDGWAEQLQIYMLDDNQEVVLDHFETVRAREMEIMSERKC